MSDRPRLTVALETVVLALDRLQAAVDEAMLSTLDPVTLCPVSVSAENTERLSIILLVFSEEIALLKEFSRSRLT
jgi:hypothetical protein